MAKMAQLHNVSVLVVNQVATSLKGVRKAVLKPNLSGHGWDAGVQNRILLYRDFAPRSGGAEISAEERRGMRFAKVLKVGGNVIKGPAADFVPFVIESVSQAMNSSTGGANFQQSGLREIRMASSPVLIPMVPSVAPEEGRTLKRKANEIADSEGDDDDMGSEDDLGALDNFLADDYEPDLEHLG